MQRDLTIQEDEQLTISEMARRYDVSPRTLRFYEQQGFLKPSRFGPQRLYSAKDRVRLEIILAGKRLHFSLREINAMIASHAAKKEGEPTEMAVILDRTTIEMQLELLFRQKAELEVTIEELQASLAR